MENTLENTSSEVFSDAWRYDPGGKLPGSVSFKQAKELSKASLILG